MTIAPTTALFQKSVPVNRLAQTEQSLTLAVAGIFAVFFIKLTSNWLSVGGRIGALGWTIFSKQELEERITL